MFVEQGGDSGKSLLSSDLEKNELLKRIRSNEVGYRMPLEGKPLADNEIETIERWVAEGAPYPQIDSTGEVDQPWWFGLGDAAKRTKARLSLFPYLLLGMLVCLLVLRRAPDSLPRWLRFASDGKVQLIAILLALFAASIFYAKQLHQELANANADLATRPKRANRPRTKNAAEPYFPGRAGKSVSPTYYRGNDERSPKLFNGGFYCTARFDLAVCNGDNEPLQVGDAILDDTLAIRLEIRRPQYATPSLFAPGIMERIYLSPVPTNQRLEGLADVVQPIRPDGEDRWVGYFPIVVPSTTKSKKTTSGSFFVCKGNVDGDSVSGFMHYGVNYDLVIVDGVLHEASDIRMNCIFRPGGVQPLEPGQIQQSEWFDYRPIPYPSASNSSDPKLLGIDEHLGDG